MCTQQEVMDGLGVDRDGEYTFFGGYQNTGNIHGSITEFYDKEETFDVQTAAAKNDERPPSPSKTDKTDPREDDSGSDTTPQDSPGVLKNEMAGSDSTTGREAEQKVVPDARANIPALDCCGVADSLQIT